MILRRNYKSADPETYNSADILEELYDADELKYVDHNVPLTSYLEYEVVGVYSSYPYYNYTYVYSNVISFERQGLTNFYLNPADVVPDIPNHRLYVIGADSGKISMIDYASKTLVKSIITNATLSYSALGTYNGVEELYVPRNDGWVYIYNASTLDKIDQINAGSQCASVVYNNGKLFVSAITGSYQYSVEVLDRSSKSVIATINNTEYLMHLKLVPGSNTKLFGIGSYDVFSFEFDANGAYVSWNTANSDYGYSNARAFGIFPDGQYFITSNVGAIYTGALTMVQLLPYGNYQYSGFTFNSPFTKILAGCSNYKNIVEYSYPGYSEQQTYHCIGYPMSIFIDNNNVISLSSIYSDPYYGEASNYIIETIPMSKKIR